MKRTSSIETLQRKPLGTRFAILTIAVVVIMGIIIGIWIMQLKYELGSASTDETPSLFQSISQQIRGILNKSL